MSCDHSRVVSRETGLPVCRKCGLELVPDEEPCNTPDPRRKPRPK